MIKDSGERTQYETGAVRDCKEGKGRCDLMPLDVAGMLDDYDFLGLIECFREYGSSEFLIKALQSISMLAFSCAKHEMLLEVSHHFEEGAAKYGENNWQKGIPIHSYIDSAVRHYLKYRAGWTDERHDRACVWNLMCCIWTMEHHPEMDDFTEEGKDG